MTWQTTLDISDLQKAYETGELRLEELAAEVVERLHGNPYFKQSAELRIIAESIEAAKDRLAYDTQIEKLYRFGELNHRIQVIADASEGSTSL